MDWRTPARQMYFTEHMAVGVIAEKLGTKVEYISRLITSDSRYKSEKLYRARQAEQRRTVYRRDYMRDYMRERRTAAPIEISAPNGDSIRREHDLAVIELSREKF